MPGPCSVSTRGSVFQPQGRTQHEGGSTFVKDFFHISKQKMDGSSCYELLPSRSLPFAVFYIFDFISDITARALVSALIDQISVVPINQMKKFIGGFLDNGTMLPDFHDGNGPAGMFYH